MSFAAPLAPVTGKLEQVTPEFQIYGFSKAIQDRGSYWGSLSFSTKSSITLIGTGFNDSMMATLQPSTVYTNTMNVGGMVVGGYLSDEQVAIRNAPIQGTVRVISPTMAILTFDMDIDTYPLYSSENYNLIINHDDQTTTISNSVKAFLIQNMGTIQATLDIPQSVRVGRVYKGYIVYENTTQAEWKVPVFTISANVPVGLTTDSMESENIQLLGLGTQEAGILAPGESGRVPFYFVAGSNTHISMGSWVDDETTTPMFESEYWTTWAEFHEDLSEAVNQLAARGIRTLDYDSTVEFLLAQKAGEPSTGLSGYLYHTGSQSPLANCEIQASWVVNAGTEDEEIHYDYATTDDEGFYAFNFLPVGMEITFELTAGAYDLSQTMMTLTEDKDVTGYQLTALPFGTVTGRVINQNGRTVNNATVTVTAASGQTRYATTDRLGVYSFDDLQQGTYTISVETYGKFRTSEEFEITISDGTIQTGRNLLVTTGAEVSGSVVGSENQLIVGAFVTITDSEGTQIFTITDENGQYYVGSLAYGEISITVSADGFVEYTGSDVTESNSILTKNVSLVDGLSVSGTIRNALGNPVSNAMVILTDANEKQSYVFVEADGSYIVKGLVPGVYSLAIYDSVGFYLNQKSEITLEEDVSLENVNFVWQKTATLSGVITDSNENGYGGLTLTLSNGVDYYQTDQTLADGSYSFINLLAGTYTLSVSGMAQTWTVTCDGSGTSLVQNITVESVGCISGTLTDSLGQPVPFAEIQVYKGNDFVSSVYTDENGTISMHFREAGTYSLFASCESGIFTPQTDIVIESGCELELNMTLGAKSASVSCSGLTAGDSAIRWSLGRLNAEGEVVESFGGESESLTGFGISGLIAGDYKLIAARDNYLAETTFTVSETDSSVSASLTFAEKSTLTVSVTYPQDAVADLDNVIAWLYNSENKFVNSSYANEDGEFTFSLLDNGTYKLVVLNGQYVQMMTVTVDELAETTAVTLIEAPVTITGTVTLDGQSVEGAAVLVENKDGVIIGLTHSDAEGNFTLYALAAEIYHLIASYNDLQSISIDVASENITGIHQLTLPAYSEIITTQITNGEPLPSLLDTRNSIIDVYYYYNGPKNRRDAYNEVFDKFYPYHNRWLTSQPSKVLNPCKCIKQAAIQYNQYIDMAQSSIKTVLDGLKQLDKISKEADDLYWKRADKASKVLLSLMGAPGAYMSLVLDLGKEVYTLRSECNDFAASLENIAGIARDIYNIFLIEGYDSIESMIKALEPLVDNALDILAKMRNKVKYSVDELLDLRNANMTLRRNSALVNMQFCIKALQILDKVFVGIDFFKLWEYSFKLKDKVDDFKEQLNLLDDTYIPKANINIARVLSMARPVCKCSPCKCDKKPDPPDDKPKDDGKPDDPHSCDPNEMVGPVGTDFTWHDEGTEDEPFMVIDGANWIYNSEFQENEYRIYFENKSTATAAAQEVFVTTVLPEAMDWSTFQVDEISIGSEIFTLSDDCLIAENTWIVNQSSTGEQIKIRFDFDEETGEATWYLRSYINSTHDNFPLSAYDGFLPPNDDEHSGEGYIAYHIRYDTDIATGTVISTSASIIFDTNEAIETNVWLNTIDVDAPVSVMSTEYVMSGYDVTLSWTGSDVGSGITSYDLYVSVNGGNFVLAASGLTETSYTYTLEEDGPHSFKVIATDGVGNVEDKLQSEITVSRSSVLEMLTVLTTQETSLDSHAVSATESPISEWDTVYLEMWHDQGIRQTFTMEYNSDLYTLDTESWRAQEGVTLQFISESVENGMTTLTVSLDASDVETNGKNTLLASLKLTPNHPTNNLAVGESAEGIVWVDGDALATTVYSVIYDLNESGSVEINDLVAFARLFGQKTAENPDAWKADFNCDERVDISDLVLFARNFGLTTATSSNIRYSDNYTPHVEETLDPLPAAPALETSVAWETPTWSGTTQNLVPEPAAALPTITDRAWNDLWSELEEEEEERLAEQLKTAELAWF